MSTRSNPFEEIERLFERMSRQFEEASRNWEPGESLDRWSSGFESVAVDLVEKDDEFVATVDLPGFDRDDVTITVTDHTLRIEADHEEALDEEEADYIRHERRRQSVSRSVRLPEEVDKETVAARMKNGVLTVSLPKVEAEEARKIDIE